MNLDEIKELIQLVQESGVAELEVQRGDNRVRIRKSSPPAPQEILVTPTATVIPAATMNQVAAPITSAGSTPAPAVIASADTEDDSTLTFVKSPIVGTFYESASPGSAPFVKVNDQVSPGQVLCIIESMKLMNEIESEISGTIVRKLVENGKPVEYGQALFVVRPS